MKTKFVVLTGGPGAGKTAVLELAKKRFTRETAFIPESASLIFSGGFWRLPSMSAKMAAQRAIFHVQDELERLVTEEATWKFGLCDRGTLDGLAYWPDAEELFWKQINSSKEAEYKRYFSVIHMRTPDSNGGYNFENKLRVETPEQAHLIDRHIESIWSAHPNYLQIPNSPNFLDKALAALSAIQKSLTNGAHERIEL